MCSVIRPRSFLSLIPLKNPLLTLFIFTLLLASQAMAGIPQFEVIYLGKPAGYEMENPLVGEDGFVYFGADSKQGQKRACVGVMDPFSKASAVYCYKDGEERRFSDISGGSYRFLAGVEDNNAYPVYRKPFYYSLKHGHLNGKSYLASGSLMLHTMNAVANNGDFIGSISHTTMQGSYYHIFYDFSKAEYYNLKSFDEDCVYQTSQLKCANLQDISENGYAVLGAAKEKSSDYLVPVVWLRNSPKASFGWPTALPMLSGSTQGAAVTSNGKEIAGYNAPDKYNRLGVYWDKNGAVHKLPAAPGEKFLFDGYKMEGDNLLYWTTPGGGESKPYIISMSNPAEAPPLFEKLKPGSTIPQDPSSSHFDMQNVKHSSGKTRTLILIRDEYNYSVSYYLLAEVM